MSNPEARNNPEVHIDPQQAFDFVVLFRGTPRHYNYRSKPFSEEERSRAENLIDQIVTTTPGIKKESLSKLMFDSPIMRKIPGHDHMFGFFEYATVADSTTWLKDQREILRDYYLVGEIEKQFLIKGSDEVNKRFPHFVFYGSAKAA